MAELKLLIGGTYSYTGERKLYAFHVFENIINRTVVIKSHKPFQVSVEYKAEVEVNDSNPSG